MRRVSISFRDSSLFTVFETTLDLVKDLTEKIALNKIAIADQQIIPEILEKSLSLTLKCLTFEFQGILLDETLEDPVSTQVPFSWRAIIEETTNIDPLFVVAGGLYPKSD